MRKFNHVHFFPMEFGIIEPKRKPLGHYCKANHRIYATRTVNLALLFGYQIETLMQFINKILSIELGTTRLTKMVHELLVHDIFYSLFLASKISLRKFVRYENQIARNCLCKKL